MKVWLDDVRPMPEGFDRHAATAAEAIALLAQGGVTHISLDHDLGNDAGSGYDVACWIEQAAYHGLMEPVIVRIHSANPVGLVRMQCAVARARHFWWTRDERHLPEAKGTSASGRKKRKV
jgi:hypothetical protein